MKTTLGLVIALAVLAGCRPELQNGDTMADMTPAEHARMESAPAQPDRAPVRLSPAAGRAIGVSWVAAERGTLRRDIRAAGQVEVAEPRVADVTARIDGFVERVFVDATGARVRRGQPLLTLYSPMLLSAEEELLTARRLLAATDSTNGEPWRNANALVAAARRRLQLWNITSDQVERLEQAGEATTTLTLVAPVDGMALEKGVVPGQAVSAGTRLYRVADLSVVWLQSDVFEQDLAAVRVGASAQVDIAAYPGRVFTGRVDFVAPVIDSQSRAARVRVVLPNRDLALRPGMYGTLHVAAELGRDVLSVPADAVVMTGGRDLVFVAANDGRVEPRAVTIGARAGDRVQVLGGLAAGERVVASANFLVDAESRLGATGEASGMPGMDMSVGRGKR